MNEKRGRDDENTSPNCKRPLVDADDREPLL